MKAEERGDSVAAHGVLPTRKGGSIPASSLHYWVDTATNDAIELIERCHYTGRAPDNINLVVTAHESGGLFGDRGRCVAAVVFTNSGTRWRFPVLELSRLVRRDDIRPPLSQLVAFATRVLRRRGRDLLVSYADVQQGHHGGIYQAAGWTYAGCRSAGSEGVIVNGEFIPGRTANNRFGTRSIPKLAERGIVASDKRDEGKHLYYRVLSNLGKDWARSLGLDDLPYPKPGQRGAS
jgi:hypothetical protein